MQLFITLVLALCGYMQVNVVQSGRILVVTVSHSYSHQMLFHPILRELNKRGHELVVITSAPINDTSLKNFTEIDTSNSYPNIRNYNFVARRMSNRLLDQTDVILSIATRTSSGILNHPDVRRLYSRRSDEKFDLVIVEYMPYYPLFAFAYRFDTPLVGLTSLNIMGALKYNVGLPMLPSHPSNWDMQNSTGFNLSFWDRLDNFIAYHMYILWWQTKMEPGIDKITKQFFGDDTPYVRDIAKNVSLVLVNHHNLLSFPTLVVPKHINIGGMYTSINITQVVPEDLQVFMDNAIDGFVYVSFGGNVLFEHLTPPVMKTFIEVFSNLPWKVVWKHDDSPVHELIAKNENIFTLKWLPQRNILSMIY